MEGNSNTVDLQIQRPAFDSFVGATHIPAAPTMSFVGAATVLEPEHVTVGAAPMPAAPKKSPVAINCFSCCHVRGALLQLSLLVDLNTKRKMKMMNVWKDPCSVKPIDS